MSLSELTLIDVITFGLKTMALSAGMAVAYLAVGLFFWSYSRQLRSGLGDFYIHKINSLLAMLDEGSKKQLTLAQKRYIFWLDVEKGGNLFLYLAKLGSWLQMTTDLEDLRTIAMLYGAFVGDPGTTALENKLSAACFAKAVIPDEAMGRKGKDGLLILRNQASSDIVVIGMPRVTGDHMRTRYTFESLAKMIKMWRLADMVLIRHDEIPFGYKTADRAVMVGYLYQIYAYAPFSYGRPSSPKAMATDFMSKVRRGPISHKEKREAAVKKLTDSLGIQRSDSKDSQHKPT